MMFKNAVLFHLDDFNLSAHEIDEKMSERPLMPPGAMANGSSGWIAAHPDGALAYGIESSVMICAGYEDGSPDLRVELTDGQPWYLV